MDFPKLTEREESVFYAVMDDYISNAGPVGSRKIAKKFHLSPATIRNIMADLEDVGLLEQPHVSAGRVPSDIGYRFFVNSLFNKKKFQDLDAQSRKTIRESITVGMEISGILEQVSNILSELTKFAGIVVSPKMINTVYKRIQFIKLSERRVLAIFIAKSGIVQNKVIRIDQDFSQERLDRISNLLNERLAQKTLTEVRAELISMIEEDRRRYDKLLDSATTLGEKALNNDLFGKERVFLEGAINMFELPEFKNLAKLRELFTTFTEQSAMIRLLDQCLDSDGVVVAIGDDTQIPEISDMSVVAAKYSAENTVGGLGVIGPKRMQYSYVVSLVKYMADALSLILENPDDPKTFLDAIEN